MTEPDNWLINDVQKAKGRIATMTPKSPKQALLNALVEMDEKEISEPGEQLTIILHHLRGFDTGAFWVAMMEHVSLAAFLRRLWEAMNPTIVEEEPASKHEAA